MLKEGTPTHTQVEMTQVVLPQFTNSIGTVFGGQIVSWMDICAAVSAQRHARGPVVTVSMDSIYFIEPIKQGFVVILKSKVNAAFHTSMEVGISVEAENPHTGERHKTMRGYFTFVKLNALGKPDQVPPLLLQTDEDRRRNANALQRRSTRLQNKQPIQ